MFAADSRFEVLEINQKRTNRLGSGDADIVMKHRATGRQIRVEVKELKPESQRSDLKRLKNQILKMAEDAKKTGEAQVLINRHPVLPELREFAERHGVKVFENVNTGETTTGMDFSKVANALDHEAKTARWVGRAKAGFVLVLAVFTAYEQWTIIDKYRRGESTRTEFLFEEASFVAGSALGAAGAWAGFELGALLGSCFGPVGTGIGGFLGSVIGGYAGYWVGSTAVSTAKTIYFQWQDEKERARYREALLRYCEQTYCSPSPGQQR